MSDLEKLGIIRDIANPGVNPYGPRQNGNGNGHQNGYHRQESPESSGIIRPVQDGYVPYSRKSAGYIKIPNPRSHNMEFCFGSDRSRSYVEATLEKYGLSKEEISAALQQNPFRQ